IPRLVLDLLHDSETLRKAKVEQPPFALSSCRSRGGCSGGHSTHGHLSGLHRRDPDSRWHRAICGDKSHRVVRNSHRNSDFRCAYCDPDRYPECGRFEVNQKEDRVSILLVELGQRLRIPRTAVFQPQIPPRSSHDEPSSHPRNNLHRRVPYLLELPLCSTLSSAESAK